MPSSKNVPLANRILITGNKGFIGSWLMKRLDSMGFEVMGVDLPTGDITNHDQMAQVFADFNPDTIVHLAAFHPLSLGEANPPEAYRINVLGTLNLLQLCSQYTIGMIYASTGAIYGNEKRMPVKEEYGKEAQPNSHYGVSKIAAEKVVEHYHLKRQTPTVTVRFSSVYGPHRKEGPINQMMERIIKEGKVTVYGDGKTTRDYTYVDDIVDGLIRLIQNKMKWGTVYNLASGVETSIIDVISAVEKVTGKAALIEYQEEKVGDIPRNYFDISKALKQGYKPRISLEEGVKKLYEFYKDNTD